MNRLMTALGAAALLGATSFAALADEASGAITAIDPNAKTVTLDNGSTYTLPASVDAASLQVGQKVMIQFDKASDGSMAATAVQPQS
jgi:hypothetical protein